jgi:hypothetical protein
LRLAIVAVVLLLWAGVASAAPPGTPELRPNDPGYTLLPGPLDQVDAPALWALEAGKPCSVKIAVVDAGFAPSPDVPFGTVFNFADGIGDQDHGEEVASVIGASFDNGIGAAGLAVGCPLLPIRIFDQTEHADGYALEEGINAAASTPGVRVINLSLWLPEGSTPSPGQLAAIRNATGRGILVVIGAGNGASNNGVGTDDPSSNPLASASPEAIRVAGVTPAGQVDHDSNRGVDWVDVAAPFVMPVALTNGSWTVVSGTSFSTPVVSAIAAEMFNVNPVLDPAFVKRLLVDTCAKTGIDVACGGVVDAYQAVVAAADAAPVHLSVTRARGGTIAAEDNAVVCGVTCSATLSPEARVVLIATPDAGYSFAGWRDACAASGKSLRCALTLDRDAGVTAAFVPTKVGLTVSKTGHGTVRSAPGGIACGRRCSAAFDYGGAVLLEARPSTGYVAKWTSGCRSRAPTCRIKTLKAATHVKVAFVPVP